MALAPTRTDAKKLRAVLDPNWAKLKKDQLADLDAVCLEAMEKAFEVYEAKAKFVVVGQLYYSQANGKYAPWDPATDRVALGPFPSEATARKGVEQLGRYPGEGASYSGADTFLTWVLPYWPTTGAEWHARRKEQMAAEVAVTEETQAARLGAAIAAEEDAKPKCGMDVLNADMEWEPCFRPADHPGACFPKPPPPGADLSVAYMNEDKGLDRPVSLRAGRMWPQIGER